MEDFSKDCFSDDNCGKTNNDSTTSHVDISKSLILCKESTGKCNQSVGDHKTKNFTYIRIDSLCTGHIRITSGSAEGASKFCTEEPVKDCNQNNDKDCNDENCILIKWNIFYITEGNKQIKFVSVYCLVCFSHDLKVGRVKTKLSQDSSEDRRDSHECVEDTCSETGKHSGSGSSKHRNPHTVTAHQHHNADSTASTHGAVNSKVGYIEDTEGEINTNCHDSPDQTLRSSAWKCID